jgi:hypothetical protein
MPSKSGYARLIIAMVDTHGCGEGYQKNELHGREILGQKTPTSAETESAAASTKNDTPYATASR